MAGKSNLRIYEPLEPVQSSHAAPSDAAGYSLYHLLQDTGLAGAYRSIGRGHLDASQTVKAYRRISKSIEGTRSRLQRYINPL